MSTEELFYILQFYTITLAIGVFLYPITAHFFNNFEDKGYGVTRLIGLLIIGYINWILSSFKIIPFNGITTYVIFLIAVAFSLYLFRKSNITKYLKKHYKLLLFEEFIFVLAFIVFILFRASVPKIEGIEKVMDFAILNGLIRSKYMPPQDVWYSSETINYYYFGHYLYAYIYKMVNIPRAIFYNLAVSHIFATTILASFSICYQLTKRYNFAFIGATFVAIIGNLDLLVYELIEKRTDYFYAEARSLIEYTINEFPTYSFLIGDLHAHILNLPYTIAFICLLYSIYLTKKIFNHHLAFMSLLLGSFYATNSWDFLIYGFLMGLILILKFYKKKALYKSLTNVVTYGFAIAASAILLYLPYHINFSNPTGGVGLVHTRSPAFQLFVMFGYFVIVLSIFIVLEYRHLYKELFKNKETTFALTLALAGLIYILIPEVIYIKDIYDKVNPDYFRSNTMFKVWYHAWVTLAIASCYGLYYVTKRYKFHKNSFIVYPILIIFLITTVYIYKYPIISVRYIVGPTYVYKGLDGAKHLENVNKNELNLINWINRNIEGQPNIVEAPGQSYSTDNVVSAYTGLPTPAGWYEHEFGWRGQWDPIALVLGDVEFIYTSTDEAFVKSLLEKYKAKYVVLGPRELKKYGPEAGKKLSNFMEVAFSSEDTTLYELRTNE